VEHREMLPASIRFPFTEPDAGDSYFKPNKNHKTAWSRQGGAFPVWSKAMATGRKTDERRSFFLVAP